MTDWKQLRIEHGLSQQQLADQLGTPKQTYVSWEKTQRYPKEIIQKLHQIYQVTPPKDLQIELLKTSYSSGEISSEIFLQQQKELYEETNDIELGILALEAYIKLNKEVEGSELSKRIGKSIIDRIQYNNQNDAENLAKIYYLRGYAYYNQKRNSGALEQLLCAEEILEQIDSDKILLRRVVQNATTMISESGKEEDIYKYLEKVEEIYKVTFPIESEENRKKVKAWRVFIKARIHEINSEYAKAIEYLKQSKDMYLEAKAYDSVRNMEHQIAVVQYKSGDYEAAIFTILHSANQDRADLWADYQETLAFSYLEIGQHEKAEKAGIDILENKDITSISIARAYRILARIEIYKDNRQIADQYYGKAIDVLYENRLEGSTQALLIEITYEYIEFNKNKSPHAS